MAGEIVNAVWVGAGPPILLSIYVLVSPCTFHVWLVAAAGVLSSSPLLSTSLIHSSQLLSHAILCFVVLDVLFRYVVSLYPVFWLHHLYTHPSLLLNHNRPGIATGLPERK